MFSLTPNQSLNISIFKFLKDKHCTVVCAVTSQLAADCWCGFDSNLENYVIPSETLASISSGMWVTQTLSMRTPSEHEARKCHAAPFVGFCNSAHGVGSTPRVLRHAGRCTAGIQWGSLLLYLTLYCKATYLEL